MSRHIQLLDVSIPAVLSCIGNVTFSNNCSCLHRTQDPVSGVLRHNVLMKTLIHFSRKRKHHSIFKLSKQNCIKTCQYISKAALFCTENRVRTLLQTRNLNYFSYQREKARHRLEDLRDPCRIRPPETNPARRPWR